VHLAGSERCIDGVTIGEGDHQYIAGIGILRDDGDQAIALAEVKHVGIKH
jgi:hypothetical protein